MDLGLQHTRVFVTGGTKGIGRAAVELFLDLGASVVTAARHRPDTMHPEHVIAADLTTNEGCRLVAESARERLERHRASPTCAACHAMIDPPGFALEQFDGLGAWRTEYPHGAPIDASAVMPSGQTVEGLVGLRAMLLSQPEQFAGTVASKLLSFALGRQLDHHDRPFVRQVVRDAAADDYRWSALILGVVRSPAFLMRTAATD